MEKVCSQCGAAFPRPPQYSRNQWDQARFCSRRCTIASRTLPIPLCACGCGRRTSRHDRKWLRGHRPHYFKRMVQPEYPGDPMPGCRYIPLRTPSGAAAAWAVVSEVDYARLSERSWHLSRGYARSHNRDSGPAALFMHREVLGLRGDHLHAQGFTASEQPTGAAPMPSASGATAGTTFHQVKEAGRAASPTTRPGATRGASRPRSQRGTGTTAAHNGLPRRGTSAGGSGLPTDHTLYEQLVRTVWWAHIAGSASGAPLAIAVACEARAATDPALVFASDDR
jgi:hypothetical protein